MVHGAQKRAVKKDKEYRKKLLKRNQRVENKASGKSWCEGLALGALVIMAATVLARLSPAPATAAAAMFLSTAIMAVALVLGQTNQGQHRALQPVSPTRSRPKDRTSNTTCPS